MHTTIPIKVWADVDLDIAVLVLYLQTIPGVRTLYSCQGTIGEGGPYPYRPQIGITWPDDETLKQLLVHFDITLQGNYWGELHPRYHHPIVFWVDEDGDTIVKLKDTGLMAHGADLPEALNMLASVYELALPEMALCEAGGNDAD